MVNRVTNYFLVFIICFSFLLAPYRAEALDRDVKDVMKSAAYGAAGGTVMGLGAYLMISDPRTPKNIFLGTSIGLFLGIVAGFYYINNRDEGNPLHALDIDIQPSHAMASYKIFRF